MDAVRVPFNAVVTTASTRSRGVPVAEQSDAPGHTNTSRYNSAGRGNGAGALSGTSITALASEPVLPVELTRSPRLTSPHRKTWTVLLFRVRSSIDSGAYTVPRTVNDGLGSL